MMKNFLRSKRKKQKNNTFKILNNASDKTVTYFRESGIHGFRFVFQKNSHIIEKIFWAIICVASIAAMISLFQATLNSYQSNPILYTAETDYLRWNTTFPAVFVCEYRIQQSKLDELGLEIVNSSSSNVVDALRSSVKESNILGELKSLIKDIVLFERPQNDNFGKKSSLWKNAGFQMPDNSYWCRTPGECFDFNYKDIATRLLGTCQEIFVNCLWNNKPFECCEGFKSIGTYRGTCFAFNSLLTEGSKREDIIKLNRTTGPGALQFEITNTTFFQFHVLDSEDVIYYGRPGEWQNWMSLQPNRNLSGVHIYFKVNEYFNDPALSELSIEERGCRYGDENNLEYAPFTTYSYGACLADCGIQSHLEIAGCRLYQTTAKKAEICNGTQLQELMKEFQHTKIQTGYMADELTRGGLPTGNKKRPCYHCLPSCTEVDLILVGMHEFKATHFLTQSVNLTMVGLPTVRTVRTVVRSKLDLVIAVGGGAGLFLGASLLSVVEILYYFCCRGTRRGSTATAESILLAKNNHLGTLGYSVKNRTVWPLKNYYE